MKFTAIFDKKSGYFNPNTEYNLVFLKSYENYLNDLLRARGIVFLNEALNGLGIPLIRMGQTYGWTCYLDQIVLDIDMGKVGEDGAISIVFNASDVLYVLEYSNDHVTCEITPQGDVE